jgi:signal transduction histidine kinase
VDEPPGVEVESAFEPRWLDGELVLLRRVRRGDEEIVQGTWLDWPALREQLLEQVDPVVPASRLEPALDPVGGADDPGRRLALLPARLVPGPMPETEPRDWTPVRWTIAAAWGAALVGLVGLAALLFGALALGRRRADFVSAVTHELRSPLTSFRLHTDLLAQGAVPADEEPEVRVILEREAGRLSHLVENVLAFSRLERRPVRPEETELGALLDAVLPHLEERAERSGLALVVASPPELSRVLVRADSAGVERILLNLVDNACKYAGEAEPAELLLETEAERRWVRVVLTDHGSGVEPGEARRIFRPFHRSAARAAGSAPGVGLGLALSRRLARAMGGDLRYEPPSAGTHGPGGPGAGARFELRLRRVQPI